MSDRLLAAIAVVCLSASHASAAQWLARGGADAPNAAVEAARASEAARRAASGSSAPETAAAASPAEAATPAEGQMSCVTLAAELMVVTGELQRHQAAVTSQSRQMSRDAAASVSSPGDVLLRSAAGAIPGAGLAMSALSMARRASGNDPRAEIAGRMAGLDQSNLDMAQAAERATRLGDMAVAQGC